MIVERRLKTKTSYLAQVYDPATKKKIRSRSFGSRKEAVKEEARMLRAIEAGQNLRQPKKCPPLSECFELWLNFSRGSYAERTWKGHAYYFRHYVAPIFGRFPVDKISAGEILKYKSKIEMRPDKRENSAELNLAPETVNKIISVLALVFRFARDVLKVIKVSPMDAVKRNSVPQKKKPTWSPDQISAFLRSPVVSGSYYRPMLVLAFATGMRPGEICGLAETDLTPQGILTVSRGLNNDGHETELKTARSHRAIVLSDPLAEMLRNVLREKRRRSFARTNDFLFVGPLGAPIPPHKLSHVFLGLLRAYNAAAADPLPVMSLYGARHSFATNLIIEGKKSLLISEIMGNSTATMEHHYAHLRETMHAEALAGYAEEILG